MPLVHDKYTPDCRKLKVTDGEGQDTGQRVLKTFMGRKNVDLGNGDFAPYVWDELSQSIRYGNLECEFDVDGFQTIREFGSPETLIDEQQFELQYYREQGSKWIVKDLYQIGLTVDQQEEQCIVTRNLSDGEGNTLDIEFLFRPQFLSILYFKLHILVFINLSLKILSFNGSVKKQIFIVTILLKIKPAVRNLIFLSVILIYLLVVM